MSEYDILPSKRKNCRMRRQKRRFLTKLGICLIFVFAQSMFVGAKREIHVDGGKEWRERYLGHGTTHELLGQQHFPDTEYTEYVSNITYTKDEDYSTIISNTMTSFSRSLNNMFALNKTLPAGYIVVKGENTLVLGPKVHTDDWHDLLIEYWLVLLWVIFLLTLIIVMPFIAVCYCCFCCCQRCSVGCPDCDRDANNRMRICCGIILILLLIGILVGLIIAFISNGSMEHGFEYTRKTIRRASEDTCSFLTDISQHIGHLLVENFEELETNLNDVLANADSHIFLDLMDTSKANALVDLERIMGNLNNAKRRLKKIVNWEQDLRFYGAQLRDGIRGVKRDVTYACVSLCGNRECLNFLKKSEIENLDTSQCLHVDNIPDSKQFIHSLIAITANDTHFFPTKGIERLQPLGAAIRDALSPIKPALINDIESVGKRFKSESHVMRDNIKAIISTINLKTLRSTNTLEEVEDTFGKHIHVINMFILMIIIILTIMFTIALVFALCTPARKNEAPKLCNQGSGGMCLLLCILLIFATYSILVLIGLFYFVMGVVTHQGVCAPLRDLENNSLFRQMDKQLDLNRYIKLGENQPHKVQADHLGTEPLRLSTVIQACQADESIFKLLKKTKVYDVFDLLGWEIFSQNETKYEPIFGNKSEKLVILTPDEIEQLDNMIHGNISELRSSIYLNELCDKLTPVELPNVIEQLNDLESSLQSDWGRYNEAKVALSNAAHNLRRYNDKLVDIIKVTMRNIKDNVKAMDREILYHGIPFGDSIAVLLDAVDEAQVFIRSNAEEYVSALRDNLTQFVEKQVSDYTEMIARKCYEEVGKCHPMTYVYDRGVDLICDRLVYPLNGYWIGLQLCALLLLPAIYVAHRLMCLCKKIYPPRTDKRNTPCRICAGGVAITLAQTDEPLDSVNSVASEMTESSSEPRPPDSIDVVDERSDDAEPATTVAMAPTCYCSKHKQE